MARIIVIDDDPGMRSVLEQVLWSAGHDVLTAEEGRLGLAVSRLAPVDLLITDMLMPGMDGIETVRRFREEFFGVPIVVISGNPDLAQVFSGANSLPMVKTLAKPFTPGELLAMVGDILSNRPLNTSEARH
ncbi:MAG: hypothetical protein QOF48_2347 [Verrucomicrobiota bacterium]|jgi:DNA-binding response OmpR family regulator